ncbi:MAG: flippase [Archangiaceae bacterium]|nr:flippase [Archangiaceae bacterium]
MTAAQPGQSDALLALRNAIKLGGSLLLTWGIALGVRLALPRYLGPDAFGVVNFADAFTSTAFVVIALGVDTYIRKEVSVKPEHASDFFAGVTAIRVLLAVLLFAGIQAFLVLTDRPRETWLLVHLYGASAFFFTMNQSLSALLHAKGAVDGLSLLNIASKLVWGAGTLAVVVMGWPLWGIGLAVMVSEALKCVGNLVLTQRHLHLRWRIDRPGTRAAVVASLPIFVNVGAHTIYNKLDVSILAVTSGDREVAWYGASSIIAGLALMVTPMIGWVLMPLFARARARSEAEYTQVMRRSLELVLVIAFPTSLFMALGAREWVTLLYGPAYAPAAASLRILACIFVLTYVAILSANALILTGRAWAQAGISIAGLVVNPLLNWLFISRMAARYGEGGAGIGSAMAQVGTELVVTSVMTALVGTRAFDARSLLMIAKTVAASAATWALDAWLTERTSAPLRLAADAAVYLALILVLRAVHLRETLDFARAAFSKKKPPPEEPVPAAPAV